MSDKKAHPEGLVLEMRKAPSGIDVRRMLSKGTRLRCLGRINIKAANPKTKIRTDTILIIAEEFATSLDAKKLIEK